MGSSQKLKKNKYFSIGGHTDNHNILSFLSYKESKREIFDSINKIKRKTKINVKHFGYTKGLKSTYGKREINLLKKKV